MDFNFLHLPDQFWALAIIEMHKSATPPKNNCIFANNKFNQLSWYNYGVLVFKRYVMNLLSFYTQFLWALSPDSSSDSSLYLTGKGVIINLVAEFLKNC